MSEAVPFDVASAEESDPDVVVAVVDGVDV